jgi:hypothetical protein
VDGSYAEGELVVRLNSFKREMFGHEDLILHTADITRNRNGFERLKDTAFLRRSPAGKSDGFGLVVLPKLPASKRKEPTPATQ